MNTFLEHLILFEGFDQAYDAWEDQTDHNTIELYIDKFKMLKQQNLLPQDSKDIIKWTKQPFIKFKAFIDECMTEYDKRQKVKQVEKEGVTKVFENNKALVVKINSYEASCKYGAGTKWCIAAADTRAHWDSYQQQNINFFFIIRKGIPTTDPKYKIAVAVYEHDEDEEPVTETYDATDTFISNIDLARILTNNNIPVNIFVNTKDWMKWIKRYKHEIHPDGTISIFENITFMTPIKKLPLKFKHIEGHFTILGGGLESLEGFPETVNGEIYIRYDNLKSFKGFPKKIKRLFIECSAMTNLTGLSDSEVNLLQLESCSSLTSLKGSPKEITNLIIRSCHALTSLENMPERIGSQIFVTHCNGITSLQGIPTKGLYSIIITGCNALRHIDHLPKDVASLTISSLRIESITSFPERIVDSLTLDTVQFDFDALMYLYKHKPVVTGNIQVSSTDWYLSEEKGKDVEYYRTLFGDSTPSRLNQFGNRIRQSFLRNIFTFDEWEIAYINVD